MDESMQDPVTLQDQLLIYFSRGGEVKFSVYAFYIPSESKSTKYFIFLNNML